MIALQYSSEHASADLVYANGAMAAEGFDVDTAVTISLECDAPADDGDTLTASAERRGWWGDQFDPDGERIGSTMWQFEHALATPQTAEAAAEVAKNALAWMVEDGHVAAVDATGEVIEDHVFVQPIITKLNGDVARPGPFKVL